MHTVEFRDARRIPIQFHYNEDGSGDVIISTRFPDKEITVPFKALLEFIATWVANRRITELEQMSPRQILGIDDEEE